MSARRIGRLLGSVLALSALVGGIQLADTDGAAVADGWEWGAPVVMDGWEWGAPAHQVVLDAPTAALRMDSAIISGGAI
jgi:hypothetical protein